MVNMHNTRKNIAREENSLYRRKTTQWQNLVMHAQVTLTFQYKKGDVLEPVHLGMVCDE